MAIERIDFKDANYNPVEAAIHTARYRNTKPFVKGKKVLDAACGEGYGSLLMQMWGAEDVIGIDISATAIEKAKLLFANERVRYIEHNVESLPFPDASFDVVVSLETVEHLTNPEVFLKELRRVLKPGGTAIISCPNDHYYAQNIDDYTNIYHKRRYTWSEYKQISEAAFGEATQWLMGNSVFGFVNLPLEYCNDPEVDPRCPSSMQGIMKVRPMEAVESVPRGDYINHWVSVYYVGIWTEEKMANHGESAAVYPAPFFAIHSDKKVPEVDPYDMVKKLDQKNIDLTEMQSELRIQLKDAYTQIASEQLQKDDYKAKCDALTKDCAQIPDLRQRLETFEQERNALSEECTQIPELRQRLETVEQERNALSEECTQISELRKRLETAEQERNALSEECTQISELRERLETAEQERDALSKECTQIPELRERLETVKQERDALSEECTQIPELRERLETTMQELASLNTSHIALQDEKRVLINERDRLKQMNAMLSDEQAMVNSQITQSFMDAEQCRNQYQASQQELWQVKTELTAMHDAKAKVEKELADAKTRLVALKSETDSLVASMEDEHRVLLNERDRLKAMNSMMTEEQNLLTTQLWHANEVAGHYNSEAEERLQIVETSLEYRFGLRCRPFLKVFHRPLLMLLACARKVRNFFRRLFQRQG